MIEAPRPRNPQARLLRTLLIGAAIAGLSACGGGGVGGSNNDGTVITRTGVVVAGVADDGTASSPLAGGTCRAIDAAGNVLDSSIVEADGNYLLLVEPGLEVVVTCTARGQSQLAIRTLASTVGVAAGGEVLGRDVLPATTVLARIVAQRAADDPAVAPAAELAALQAQLIAFGSEAVPVNVDLQLLADAATVSYDALRDGDDDVDLDAFLIDLFDNGTLDFFAAAAASEAIETAAAELATAAGKSLADAVLATHPAFDFTVLNVGGARSELANAARFGTLVDAARTAAAPGAVLTLSAGDTLAAGRELAAGLETQDPFYDSLAADLLLVDALGVGSEDLELGPSVFGVFLDRLGGSSGVVVTDIDVTQEANVFVPSGVSGTVPALLLERGARRIGIISASPENLSEVTSTRGLVTLAGEERIARLQTGIDATMTAGARVQVLLTSVTRIDEIAALVGALRGIDLIVTLPGVPAVDTAFAGEGPVPLALTTVTDADGRELPLVPAVGRYAGLVAADLRADALGRLDAAAVAQVRRVAGSGEAVPTVELEALREQVSVPLQTAIDAIATATAARTEVTLDPRPENLFVGATNWGNLMADSVLFSARGQAGSFRSLAPNASIVDAGSIASAQEIGAGDIGRLQIYDLVAEAQVIAVLQRVPPADLKRLLEFSFASRGTGQFAQVASLRIEFDPEGTAQVLGEDGSVLVPGSRVVNVTLNGERGLVQDGVAVEGGPALTIAITERVRDTYPLGNLPLIHVGLSLSQAVDNFVRVTLGQNIRDEDFPIGGENRITVFNAP